MFCPHCGTQINDGDVFCKSCGKSIANPPQFHTLSTPEKKMLPKIAIILIIAVALIAAAVGAIYAVRENNKIVLATPEKASEISGMYKGLVGSTSAYIYFENSPDNNNTGLYLEYLDFSDYLDENNTSIFSGTWKFNNGEVITYNDSILEMQSATVALGGEALGYDGTVYTMYGDYLFSEEDMYNGNVPDLKKFDAVCTDGNTTYTFSKNGTYTRENEKISEAGKYSRSNYVITLTPSNDGVVSELFVYDGGITSSAYKKSTSPDQDFEAINSLDEKESKTVEKVKADLTKDTINTLKYSFGVKDIDVSCDVSFHPKDKVVYIGYASFSLTFNNAPKTLRVPLKFTINLSDSDGEVKYYSDAATIDGMTIDEIKALTGS